MTMEFPDEKFNKGIYRVLRAILMTPAHHIELSGTDPEHDAVAKIVNLVQDHTDRRWMIYNVTASPKKALTSMWFVLDGQLCVEEINNIVWQTLGRSPEELKGMPFARLFTANSRVRWYSSIEPRLSQSHDTLHKVLDFRYQASEPTPVLCLLSPSQISEQVLVSAIGFTPREYDYVKILMQSGLFGETPGTEQDLPDRECDPDEERVREVADYIEEHLDKPWSSIEELAKTFGTNEKKLKIDFKKRYKTSIYRYCINKRMDLAMDLLKNSDKSIQDIMLLSGYKTPSCFYLAFKQRFGCTPGDIKRKNPSISIKM